MIKDTNFLLGKAFALLTLIRAHLIQKDDEQAVILIEDQYLSLERAIEESLYSKNNMEKKDVSR